MAYGYEGDGFEDGAEPFHAGSSTDALLNELQLYGWRKFEDGPDPRPLPDPTQSAGAVYDSFDAIQGAIENTRLADDLQSILWDQVNVWQRALDRMQKLLDQNEQDQRTAQREQDGSEIKSVELETLLNEGMSLIERRNCMEFFRDHAAQRFSAIVGFMWNAGNKSRISYNGLTASVIASRDFINAQAIAKERILLPSGARVAFTGGEDCSDHRAIWAKLDEVKTRHPDMILMHGGSAKGADKIAACWADNRGVVQIAFKPNFAKHGRGAPFKRNEELMAAQPVALVSFPGSGISSNMVDKARAARVKIY